MAFIPLGDPAFQARQNIQEPFVTHIIAKQFEELTAVAHAAGRIIMEIYDRNPEAKLKEDKSPVTEADVAAETYILGELARICPDIPVVSEEAAADGKIPEVSELFFLVDPLDGTREFLSRNGEFTVNIGLISNGAPVAGIIYTPARSRLFRGQVGQGAAMCDLNISDNPVSANWENILVRTAERSSMVAVASRSHRDEKTDEFLTEHGVAETISAGSSLKFCLLASGQADLYPRMGRTMEWDTAAGHAILAAAGGSVITTDGDPLTYGKKERGFDNPHFIAQAWQ